MTARCEKALQVVCPADETIIILQLWGLQILLFIGDPEERKS